ncbi:MAG: AEC family transporter [Parvularculaceae bacterium]|nr:AEC family transporter [Parvularculaceae bacterium]
MVSLASLLIPLFGAILVGAVTRAMGLFDGEDGRRMSRFVFVVAMPFAGFNFMRLNPVAGDVFVGLAAGYAIATALASLAAFLIARGPLGLTVREAGAAVFATTCGNAIFLGIPIAAAVDGWASPFLVLVLMEGTLVFALGTALMTWPEADGTGGESSSQAIFRSVRTALGRALQNPIVVSILLGLVAGSINLPIPDALSGFFGFMGRTAGPVGLFVLGVTAANLVLEKQITELKGAALLLPIKLVFFPAVTAGLVWLFTNDPAATSVAALFTGLPPAVASIVLSNVYKQWVGGVSAVVTIGSMVGLVSLAAYLAVVVPT